VAEAIATTKAVLAARPSATPGEIVLRGDSAFYSRKVSRLPAGLSATAED
jgi:hypothetical protein